MSIVPTTLGQYLLPVKSVNPASVYGSNEFLYLDIASVNRTIRKITSPQTISSANAPSRARQLLKCDDVVISTVRPNLNTVAVVGPEYPNAIGSTGFCVLRANPELLDYRYLYHWVSSSKVVDYLVSVATGASYPAVSDKVIKGILFNPPSLQEQQRIAVILDRTEDIRTQRAKSIELAEDFLRAKYQEAVSQSILTGLAPKSLMDVFDFTTGKLDSNAAEEHGIYPFFTCAKETYAINSFAFDMEALLLAGNNANGDYSVKHYCGKFNAYQRTYVIQLKNKSNSYGYFRFALENLLLDLKRFSKGSNTKYLTLGILADQKLVEPPPNLQNSFEKIYKAVEILKIKMEKQFLELDVLHQSLTSKYF